MTIKEIAQLSGVSMSTVSKIMNHKDEHISPETRNKVLGIAKEYNYSPYAFARNNSCLLYTSTLEQARKSLIGFAHLS